MANTVSIRKLLDGSKLAVFHIYLASDGASGELTDQVIVAASTLDGAPTKLSICEVDYALSGFSGVLEFEATTDQPALALVAETPVKIGRAHV